MSAQSSEEKAKRRQLASMIKKDPSAALEILLDEPFWHNDVQTNVDYRRDGDDTDGKKQGISIGFSHDGDSWISVASYREGFGEENGKTEISPYPIDHRFRSGFGGGRSLRVRNALMFLALAIKLDSKDMPDRP
ncbi:MAG: hypothetical protein V4465_02220 [Patescibacteria group bacterium]